MKIALALLFVFLSISGKARAESVGITAHMAFADAAGASLEVVANKPSLVEHLPASSRVDTMIAGNVRIFGIPDQTAYLYRSCSSGTICDDTYLIGNRDKRISLRAEGRAYADNHKISDPSDDQRISKYKDSDGVVVVYL